MSRVPRLPLLPLAALALVLSGCADSGAADGHAAPPPAVASPQSARAHRPVPAHSAPARSTPAPARSPSATASSPPRRKARTRPLPRTGAASALESHLLAAGSMPTPADVSWRVAESGSEDGTAVGACQRTALVPIGAVEAVRRAFVPVADGSAVATQVVARFADGKSAWRALEVLRAWRSDCEERLHHARERVGPLRPVDVRAGTGESYRAGFRPRDADHGRATGLGIVHRGRFLSVVEVVTARAAYPSAPDPARAAVRRIARTFA
jgi:hypothetical protein